MTSAPDPHGSRLEDALRDFERKFGGPGLSAPARGAGTDYTCPNCGVDVRGITIDTTTVLRCPICHDVPGALCLGRGPTGTTDVLPTHG